MINIDSFNASILHHLQNDGRMSNIDLAKQVGLSPSACLRRVQDLERRGILKGYRAIVDRKALGQDVVVFVMVGLSGHLRKDSLAFEAAMDQAPEVQECHNITGSVEFRYAFHGRQHYLSYRLRLIERSIRVNWTKPHQTAAAAGHQL